ncbi:hypothetical protein [Paraglaciecola sp. 20A4]|uniref:hypothetical protein n=1 Tax=Paraglaciecola sp. 20A4 TaxID=2687288 RepID=UPI00197FCBB5|nr:hypothetical protein [Paraglaciecola sp. 20A4]
MSEKMGEYVVVGFLALVFFYTMSKSFSYMFNDEVSKAASYTVIFSLVHIKLQLGSILYCKHVERGICQPSGWKVIEYGLFKFV